jgi:hypothetical protein
MSFSFNPAGLVQTIAIPSKIEFINKYGNFANNYKGLNALGEQKYVWFYILIFISLFAGIVLNHLSKPKLDENNKPKERTISENLLLYSSYGCAIIFIFSIIYSGYMYFGMYLPEYNDWFSKLPQDAKVELNKIHAYNSIANYSHSNYYNYNQTPLIRFG